MPVVVYAFVKAKGCRIRRRVWWCLDTNHAEQVAQFVLAKLPKAKSVQVRLPYRHEMERN